MIRSNWNDSLRYPPDPNSFQRWAAEPYSDHGMISSEGYSTEEATAVTRPNTSPDFDKSGKAEAADANNHSRSSIGEVAHIPSEPRTNSPGMRQLPPAHNPRKRVPFVNRPLPPECVAHWALDQLDELDVHANGPDLSSGVDARLPPLHPSRHPVPSAPPQLYFGAAPRLHSAPSSRSVSPEAFEHYCSRGQDDDPIVFPALCPPTPDMDPEVDIVCVLSHPGPHLSSATAAFAPPALIISEVYYHQPESDEPGDTAPEAVARQAAPPEVQAPRRFERPARRAIRRSISFPTVTPTEKPRVPRDRRPTSSGHALGIALPPSEAHRATTSSTSLRPLPDRRKAASRPISPGRTISPRGKSPPERHSRSMPSSMPVSRPSSRPISPNRSPRKAPEPPKPALPPQPPREPSREGLLRVKVLKAWGLASSDLLKMTVDSYVRITVGRNRVTTALKQDCVDPQWNEAFVVPVNLKREQPVNLMVVEMMEKCAGQDQVLGGLEWDLAQLRQRIPVNKVLKLFDDRASYVCNARGCGKLQIELEALDFGVGARAPLTVAFRVPKREEAPVVTRKVSRVEGGDTDPRGSRTQSPTSVQRTRTSHTGFCSGWHRGSTASQRPSAHSAAPSQLYHFGPEEVAHGGPRHSAPPSSSSSEQGSRGSFRHTEPPPPAINVLKPAARGSVDVEPVQVSWVSQPSAGPTLRLVDMTPTQPSISKAVAWGTASQWGVRIAIPPQAYSGHPSLSPAAGVAAPFHAHAAGEGEVQASHRSTRSWTSVSAVSTLSSLSPTSGAESPHVMHSFQHAAPPWRGPLLRAAAPEVEQVFHGDSPNSDSHRGD